MEIYATQRFCALIQYACRIAEIFLSLKENVSFYFTYG
jgi:hypothetical protein